MEMSIDEVIKELEWALANNTIEDVESAFKYISAIHIAIDTIRRYQKIQETMNRWYEDKTWEFDTSYLYEIGELLEDGNDD